jgi:hypothetical protein
MSVINTNLCSHSSLGDSAMRLFRAPFTGRIAFWFFFKTSSNSWESTWRCPAPSSTWVWYFAQLQITLWIDTMTASRDNVSPPLLSGGRNQSQSHCQPFCWPSVSEIWKPPDVCLFMLCRLRWGEWQDNDISGEARISQRSLRTTHDILICCE